VNSIKAIVVSESFWGNTAAIARAIADGIGSEERLTPLLLLFESHKHIWLNVEPLLRTAPGDSQQVHLV
jgi:flavorubredoxin